VQLASRFDEVPATRVQGELLTQREVAHAAVPSQRHAARVDGFDPGAFERRVSLRKSPPKSIESVFL
jgi:hypothetical protein